MNIKPIHTEKEYEAMLRKIEPYFDHEPALGTPEADQFELMAMLIEAYEAKHYPIAPADPIEEIKFRMEQSDLSPKDLIPMIGQLNRVYEVLSRKRPLTLAMIRRLHEGLGISAESLIQPIAHA